jgi:RNA polymerase sigma-70 factor (ECF subfamily)
LSDRRDLEAYLSGDVGAFERLVVRYQGSLLRYAGRLLGDGDRAQDAVQETFVRLIREARTLRRREDIGAWLFRVCRNTVVDGARKEARMRRTHERAAVYQPTGNGESDPLANQETYQVVTRELDRLPDNQRDVLILRVQQRKSYSEISAITGLSSGNVGYLVHHGLRNLARRLKAAGVI